MKEQRVTPLTESGLLAALLVVLGQAAVYLPVLGMVATLCWPLPLIVLVVRHGMRWGVLGLLVAGVVMGLLIEPTLAARMVLAFGPTGLMLGLGFRRQWSGTKVFGAGLAGSIVAKLASLGLLFALTGINPWDAQLSLLRQSFEESFGLYGQLGVPEQDIATSRTQIEAGLQLVSVLLPLVREKVKGIVCLGLDNRKIHQAFESVVGSGRMVDVKSADEAVKEASRMASDGDVVLLSPCCASFDLFTCYEDRGEKFKEAVRNL